MATTSINFIACSKDDDTEPNSENEITAPGNVADEEESREEQPAKPDDSANIHEYVDLGLPSGTLWATCNVGANSPADYGDYFAWGETEPVGNYGWETYKWCYGSFNTLSKYVLESESKIYGYFYCEICKESFQHSDDPEDKHEYTPIHFFDDKTQLESSDDAATVNWGSEWCMPTVEQITELVNNTILEWTTMINSKGVAVNGYLVKGKAEGYTDCSIFLPTTGFCDGISLYDAGRWGDYWSSTLNPDYACSAYNLDFSSDYINCYSYYRYYGLSVRPVRASAR